MLTICDYDKSIRKSLNHINNYVLLRKTIIEKLFQMLNIYLYTISQTCINRKFIDSCKLHPWYIQK